MHVAQLQIVISLNIRPAGCLTILLYMTAKEILRRIHIFTDSFYNDLIRIPSGY